MLPVRVMAVQAKPIIAAISYNALNARRSAAGKGPLKLLASGVEPQKILISKRRTVFHVL
jgi:hypothetical protein